MAVSEQQWNLLADMEQIKRLHLSPDEADALRAVIAEARQARELREALAASEALLEDSEGDARAIWVAVVGPRNRALLEATDGSE